MDGTEIDATEIDAIEMDRQGWPPALIKAAQDTFRYHCGLRGGRMLCFEMAELLPNGWVRLEVSPSEMGIGDTHLRECDDAHLNRGVEIRVSEIVWVADSGH